MTRTASGWRWRLIGRPTSTVPSERVFSTAGDILTYKRSHLSTDNAEKRLILKEILHKFLTGCNIEQCEFKYLFPQSVQESYSLNGLSQTHFVS